MRVYTKAFHRRGSSIGSEADDAKEAEIDPAMSGTSFRVDLVILPLSLIQEERLSVNCEIHVLYTLSTGKLSPEGLSRNSVVGITDHPELTLSVYREHKTRNQTNTFFPYFSTVICLFLA